MKSLIFSLLTACVVLAGCSEEPPAPVSKPFCASIKPVCVSRHDKLTEETATTIEGNELSRTDLCGSPPPCTAKKQVVKKKSPATS